MAVVYALLGTIVAEFLGAQQGMGVVITQAQAVTDVAGVFAALVILGAWASRCTPSCAGSSTASCTGRHRGKH